MQFKSVTAYLKALRDNPDLAMIPLSMVAEWKGISRSAVSEQVKSGNLEGIEIKGKNKVWRGIRPQALFVQEAGIEAQSRQRRDQVRTTLAQAAATGQQISYGEAMAPAGLSSRNPRDRAEIGTLLSELSRESLTGQGILISAIVVQKTTGRPNAQFFALARELGCLRNGADEATFWHDQKARVFRAFSAPSK